MYLSDAIKGVNSMEYIDKLSNANWNNSKIFLRMDIGHYVSDL